MTAAPLVRPADDDLARLADLLNQGRRVTLFCGIGCAGAHDEVVALAEKLKAPVGYSFRGKEWVEHDNPNAVGMSGLLGWGAAYKAMHECDVLLLLGTDFPYETLHADDPQDRPDRPPRRAAGPAVASSTWACAAMSATRSGPCCRWWSRSPTGRSWTPCSNSTASRGGSSAPTSITSASGGRSTPSTSPPRWTSWPARTPCSPSIPGCAASGAPATCGAAAGRRFLGSFNHGSMANALPQAIGAQTAYPGRQVISLSGDGGLAMLMGELLTIAQYQLPVKIVLFDNHRLGMVQLEHGGRRPARTTASS